LTRQPRPALAETPPQPIPRARVMNLIVRAGRVPNLEPALDEINQLAQCHPLRALIVHTQSSPPTVGLDAVAAIECAARSGPPRTVCLERIQLTPSATASAHLSSVVAPLLIPDLPVVLWWLDGLPRPNDPLLDLSGNLIVDSDTLGGDFSKLGQLVGASGDRVNLRDRAWIALESVRGTLAELFDPAAARPYQFGITALQITFAANAPAQPLLLLGWLASRLNWTATPTARDGAKANERLQFASRQGPITATLTGRTSPPVLTECNLVKVELTSVHAGQAARFTIARQPAGDFRASRSAIPGLPPVDYPVFLSRPPLVAVLNDLLAFPKEDQGYREALGVAAQLAGRPDLTP
ncbi:MAG TPA: glucose-6-phosphate dehydrogenase assembly protein OpcA, partial [Chloroflexota bacterium]|nr:glucose-6-phosphate dehydrogenase assembly protein OpcA [Chloroflexota bacterium]